MLYLLFLFISYDLFHRVFFLSLCATVVIISSDFSYNFLILFSAVFPQLLNLSMEFLILVIVAFTSRDQLDSFADMLCYFS